MKIQSDNSECITDNGQGLENICAFFSNVNTLRHF